MARTALQCPVCKWISAVPEEEAQLLRLGAKALLNCPVCQAQFVGEPGRTWTFHSEENLDGRYPPDE